MFPLKNNYYPSFNTNFKKVNLVEELGTYANPIQVSSKEDMLNIDPSKSYILSNDIDLNGVSIKAIGSYKEPFYGTFDGNGYTISNITISNDSNTGYNSLFGYVNGSIVNLKTTYKVDYVSSSKMSAPNNSYVNSVISPVSNLLIVF